MRESHLHILSLLRIKMSLIHQSGLKRCLKGTPRFGWKGCSSGLARGEEGTALSLLSEVGHFDVAERVYYLPSICSFSSGDRREMHRRSSRKVATVAISCSRGSSDPGMEPRSPPLQADSSPSEPPGKPPNSCGHTQLMSHPPMS